MHNVILSETPMARQSCNCTAENDHWLGEEVAVAAVKSSPSPSSTDYLKGYSEGVKAERRRRHYEFTQESA